MDGKRKGLSGSDLVVTRLWFISPSPPRAGREKVLLKIRSTSRSRTLPRTLTKICERRVDPVDSTDPLAAAGMQYESQIETQRERYIQMNSTRKAVDVSAQTTRTKFDGVLLTIRSRKSYFQVTQAIERSLQRFHIPKLMEYVTHGNSAGVEAYVDSTSRPFSIFFEFEQAQQCALRGFPSNRSSTSSGML
jgi:hypothetical protein